MRVTTQVVGFDVHEFVIPGPAYGKDVEDAFRMAREQMAEMGIDPSFDDSLTVEGRDSGEVVVWFRRDRGNAVDNLNSGMAAAWDAGYVAARAEMQRPDLEGPLNPYLMDAMARRDRRARVSGRTAKARGEDAYAQNVVDAVTGE